MLRKISAAAFAAGLAAALAPDLGAQPVAAYRIACRYDEGKRTLEGTERMDWRNATGRPVTVLRFEMAGNALRNNRSTYWREARARGAEPDSRDGSWGSLSVSRMTGAAGEDLLEQGRFVAPDDANADDRTLLEIPLEKPVAPGDTLRLDIDFVARLPRLGFRGGWKGGFVFARDWFPAIAVLGASGWATPQIHFGAETGSESADFDVVLDLPSKFRGRVGGSGRLLEEREAPKDRVLEHFRAEAIRGFAWAADPDIEVETERITAPGSPDLGLTLLTQPEHRIYRARFLRAARVALAELRDRYGPFPFSSLTICDIPWGPGGPLRITAPGVVAGRAALLSPDRVWAEGSPEAIVLEGVAAQWFDELPAPEPSERIRLGRAVSRFEAARIDRLAYGPSHGVLPLFGYPIVLRSVEIRPGADARPADDSARLEAALATFDRAAGEKAVDAALSSYLRGARLRHPAQAEFLTAVEGASGRSWADFFRSVLRGAAIDLSVAKAVSIPSIPPAGIVETDGRTSEVSAAAAPHRRGFDTEVLVVRRGEAVVPAEIRLDFEGGKTYRTVWNGASEWIRLRVEDGPKLRQAAVDPDSKILLDSNRGNNGWIVRGDAAAANLWTARAFFWSENLIDLFLELW